MVNEGGQDTDNNIYAKRYDKDSNPIGSIFPVNTNTQDQQIQPSIAMSGSGNFVIVWDSSSPVNSLWNVYARRFDYNANPIENEFQVSSFTSFGMEYPAVTINDDGKFVIAWQYGVPAQWGSEYDILAQKYYNDGSPWGANFQVNTYTKDDLETSSVSMNNEGKFTITWQSIYQPEGDDFYHDDVFAQQYDNNGNKFGREFQVDNNYSGSYPCIAMNTLNFVIAWEGSPALYDDDYIFARIFGANAQQTATPSMTKTPTITATNTITLSQTPSETGIPTFTGSNTVTPAPTPSLTITPTITRTKTLTPSPTPTLSATETPKITATMTLTFSPTPTLGRTPTMTRTQTLSPTPNLTPKPPISLDIYSN